MAKITVTKIKKLPFDAQAVANAVIKVLNQTGKVTVEADMVSEDFIKDINKRFRSIDRVTDVLSFPSLDGVRYKDITVKDFPLDVVGREKSVFIGSIIICKERAIEQAVEFGHSLERELCYLFCHGLLHLFGYDHETESDDIEMRSLANEVLKEIKVFRI